MKSIEAYLALDNKNIKGACKMPAQGYNELLFVCI